MSCASIRESPSARPLSVVRVGGRSRHPAMAPYNLFLVPEPPDATSKDAGSGDLGAIGLRMEQLAKAALRDALPQFGGGWKEPPQDRRARGVQAVLTLDHERLHAVVVDKAQRLTDIMKNRLVPRNPARTSRRSFMSPVVTEGAVLRRPASRHPRRNESAAVERAPGRGVRRGRRAERDVRRLGAVRARGRRGVLAPRRRRILVLHSGVPEGTAR